MRPSRTARAWARSILPSQRAITRVATMLPMALVMQRSSLRMRSTPMISAMPATGRSWDACRVAASTNRMAPATPATPFEVTSAMARIPSSCSQVSGMLSAWAMKPIAMVR